MKKSLAAAAVAAVLTLTLGNTAAQAADPVSITGAGSTFVANYLEACKPGFSAATGNIVNYTATGSGTGRTNFMNGTVDFAISDSLFKATDKVSDYTYVPLIAGPVAIMYNLPSVKDPIQLSTKTLANIFAGNIKNWNDPQIAADNVVKAQPAIYKNLKKLDKKTKKYVTVKTLIQPAIPAHTLKIASTPITVAYRSDSSGTSQIVSDYLHAVQPSIFTKSGSGTFSAALPNGVPADGTFQAASGSDGVSNLVAQKVGAVAYSEMSFAKERKLGVATLQNAAGKWIAPTAAGASAFLSNFGTQGNGVITPNYTNTDPAAYNLSAFTYGVAHTKGMNAAKADAVRSLFTYLADTCAPLQAEAKFYAPLPAPVLTISKIHIAEIG